MAKSRLGKGLSALIVDGNDGIDNLAEIKEVYLDNIFANPYQPRTEFDEESMNNLRDSIIKNGLIQPVTLRKIKPDQYQLVVGERRWRASKMAGLKKIPAIIKECTDEQMMEIALIENLQREDLNPIEEAQAYHKMINEFTMTQEEVAKRVGKSRSSIANMVRLLKLAPKVQVYVSRETLSMGHARTLLSLKDKKMQIEVADYLIDRDLSVRETEEYINNLNKNKKSEKKKTNKLDTRWKDAAEKLSSFFKSRVKIKQRKDKKYIMIECEEYDNLEDIINLLERKL